MSTLPNNISIRTISTADIPELIQLHSALLPTIFNRTFFTQTILHNTRLGLVAYDDCQNRIVGFVTACISRPADYPPRANSTDLDPIVTLMTLGVLHNYRRQGIAKRLVVEVAALLNPIPDPVRRINVTIRAVNDGARKFYQGLGLNDEGFVRNHFRTLPESDGVKIGGTVRVF